MLQVVVEQFVQPRDGFLRKFLFGVKRVCCVVSAGLFTGLCAMRVSADLLCLWCVLLVYCARCFPQSSLQCIQADLLVYDAYFLCIARDFFYRVVCSASELTYFVCGTCCLCTARDGFYRVWYVTDFGARRRAPVGILRAALLRESMLPVDPSGVPETRVRARSTERAPVRARRAVHVAR